MTSNIGSQHLLDTVVQGGELNDKTREVVMNEVHKYFKPEIINRMDDIVMFSPLSQNNMTMIVDRMLVDLNNRLSDQHLHLDVSKEVKEWVAESSYEPQFGARPMKRFIQRQIETPLARKIIANDLPEGTNIVANLKDGQVVFDLN